MSNPTSVIIFLVLGACVICVCFGELKRRFPNQCSPEDTPEGQEALARIQGLPRAQVQQQPAATSETHPVPVVATVVGVIHEENG